MNVSDWVGNIKMDLKLSEVGVVKIPRLIDQDRLVLDVYPFPLGITPVETEFINLSKNQLYEEGCTYLRTHLAQLDTAEEYCIFWK